MDVEIVVGADLVEVAVRTLIVIFGGEFKESIKKINKKKVPNLLSKVNLEYLIELGHLQKFLSLENSEH